MRCTDYLEPFLDTIRQEDTSGVVTQRALCAVRAFLSAGLLTLDPTREAAAIVSIVHAATFCRFEVTDPAADEVVLMCILQLLVTCVQCPSGGALSDEAVCEVVHSCFRISSQVGRARTRGRGRTRGGTTESRARARHAWLWPQP